MDIGNKVMIVILMIPMDVFKWEMLNARVLQVCNNFESTIQRRRSKSLFEIILDDEKGEKKR